MHAARGKQNGRVPWEPLNQPRCAKKIAPAGNARPPSAPEPIINADAWYPARANHIFQRPTTAAINHGPQPNSAGPRKQFK